MNDTVVCSTCAANDCDNCETPDVSRQDGFTVCCCGRVTLGPSTPQGKAALIRAKRAHESAVRATIDELDETDGLSEAQLDGRACIECGTEVGAMVPDGMKDGVQLFRCADDHAPDLENLGEIGGAYATGHYDGRRSALSADDSQPTPAEFAAVADWLGTGPEVLANWHERPGAVLDADGSSHRAIYERGRADGQTAGIGIADASPRDLAHLCEQIGRRMGELRDGTPEPRSTAVAPHQNRPGGLILAIAVVVALGFGTLGGWLIRDAGEPRCPTEDSCQPVYEDGQWRIEQVQP